jgi:hypothetical protein
MCYLPPYRVPKRGLGERWTVRIPPAFAQCTAFLTEQKKGRPSGTAFFVELEQSERAWTYLVTARHCIEESGGRELYVRVNTETGFEDLSTAKDDWFKHDSADVAVLPSPVDRIRYPIMDIPLDLAIDKQYRFDVAALDGRGNPVLEPMLRQNFPNGINVEVGDELFSPGLFVQSAGRSRNLPVCRFGNVARMPGEEMVMIGSRARGDIPIRAYLVETHSWGGFSGAPMFWHYQYNMSVPIIAPRWKPAPESKLILPPDAPRPERIDVMFGRGWAIALLGLVSGHYDIPTKAKNEDIETALNAGIAIVTPAENIKELLMRDDLVEDRTRRAAQDKEPAATADYASRRAKFQLLPKTGVEIPIPAQGKFIEDLERATRRKKSSE